MNGGKRAVEKVKTISYAQTAQCAETYLASQLQPNEKSKVYSPKVTQLNSCRLLLWR